MIWSSSLTSWFLFQQVLNVSLLEGEQVTVEDTGGQEPFILGNETVLMRGLVLRSWSNQISIRFRRDQGDKFGSIQLHYQGEPVGYDQVIITISTYYVHLPAGFLQEAAKNRPLLQAA